jgi:subtilisin family serine protease
MFQQQRVAGDFEARVAALGGTVERSLDPVGIAIVSGLTDGSAAQLARTRGVQAVEPDLIMPLEDPVGFEEPEVAEVTPLTLDPSTAFFFPRQWHLRAIGADAAWAAGFLGSPEVVVAILDTGIDYNHASLQGLVDLERSISLHPWDDEIVAENFPGAHPIADVNRHGTHVAATVVSTGEVGAGVTGHTTLFGVKVCGLTVGCPRAAVLEAIMYAADNGADIINMSLGGNLLRSADRGQWLHLVQRVTNYAHRSGTLIIVSAGNNAADLDRNLWPDPETGEIVHIPSNFRIYCDATNVVCVSATGPTMRETIDGPWNDFDQPAFFTNYGRSSIHVSAPGGNLNNFVYAACSSFNMQNVACQNSNRFIIGLRGTSMSAPHATGVAALIAAHSPRAKGNPALIRNRLHQTADQPGVSGNDPFFGKGRVNAARAVGLDLD